MERKIYLPITVCLLMTGMLSAAAPAEDNNTETEKNTSQPAQPAASSKPKAPAPAKSFTPSEKVGADSAVSFPVDI
jgi:hypothetical protein